MIPSYFLSYSLALIGSKTDMLRNKAISYGGAKDAASTLHACHN